MSASHRLNSVSLQTWLQVLVFSFARTAFPKGPVPPEAVLPLQAAAAAIWRDCQAWARSSSTCSSFIASIWAVIPAMATSLFSRTRDKAVLSVPISSLRLSTSLTLAASLKSSLLTILREAEKKLNLSGQIHTLFSYLFSLESVFTESNQKKIRNLKRNIKSWDSKTIHELTRLGKFSKVYYDQILHYSYWD